MGLTFDQGIQCAYTLRMALKELGKGAAAGTPITRLMPVFEIEGETVVMMTPRIAGISTADIGPFVMSLAEHRLDIRTAIDILTGDL